MSVTLFHIRPSLCSQKVRLALAEKGVRYHGRVVDIGPSMENYEPWYVQLNPAAVVPTLLHDDRVVTDSARIVRYVDEAFAGPALTPAEAGDRARMERWIALADEMPIRTLSYGRAPVPRPVLAFMVGLRLRRLERHARDNPELASAYRAKLEDVRRWQQGVVEPAQAEAAQAALFEALDAVEAALADGRPWLVGEAYTLADVLWTVVVARARALGLGERLAEYPGVMRWYAAARARPSFAQADILERISPRVVAPILLPWLLPRAAAAAVLLAALGGAAAIWW